MKIEIERKIEGPDQEAKQSTEEVLHQRKSMGKCPKKMPIALPGFALAGIIGYFVYRSKRNPESSALDVGKVTVVVANPPPSPPPDNTRPRK